MSALPRVLFVDDEPNILEAMTRSLRGRYELSIAGSGAAGLALLEQQPFDVIVSDMRMPEMNGAQFLARALLVQPDAVRLILSGHSDVESLAGAVNHANLFRFLFKPAPRPVLIAALDAAVEQRRLLTAEKELLERTLTGAVDALSETLALVNPAAFGRSRRLRRIVGALAKELGLERRWVVEVAASLSELGSVTLPPDVATRWYTGEKLSEVERKMVARASESTRQLLKHIPRLEPVIELLEHRVAAPGVSLSAEEGLLRVGMALERRLSLSEDFERILLEMAADPSLDQRAVAACQRLRSLVFDTGEHRSVTLQGLHIGMVLADDVRTSAGALLIARGHEVSAGLLARLRNFAATVGVKEPLLVSQVAPEAQALAPTGS